jgi:hypothetical protein
LEDLDLKLYDNSVLGIYLFAQQNARSHAIPELALRVWKASKFCRVPLSNFMPAPCCKAYRRNSRRVALEVVPIASVERVVMRLKYKLLIYIQEGQERAGGKYADSLLRPWFGVLSKAPLRVTFTRSSSDTTILDTRQQ